ncbi:MAG: Methyltransferase FkbM domain-containing protein, partial [Verrucomicrobia bacterium]
MKSTQAWMEKVGSWNYLWRMGQRQFVKRVLGHDLTLKLGNGRRVFLPKTSQFSSVAWVTGGRVDDGFEELLRWFAPQGTAFFDVGAHFGFYSVFLADLHSPVVAFEPDARSLPALKRNLAALAGAVCVEAAVSNQVGKMRFVTAASSPQSHLEIKGETQGWKETVEVDVTTLDATWRKLGHPVVGSVKIDTEGHESAVLWGGHEMIRQCRPQMLVEATAQSLA